MSKIKKIMQIKNYDERDVALRTYASELGVSTHHLVNPETGKTNEPELIARIREVENPNTKAKLTKISIFVAAGWLAWSIFYSINLYPPKYILDGTSLHFGDYFKRWVKQAQKKEASIYKGGAEFKLHFVLRNIHRGEGDVSKPILVITAENNNKEYEIKPKTSYTTSEKVGENVTAYTTKDLGRTIHVSSHGIVDEFFEYSISKRREDKDREIVEFLETNKDKLQFKIRGYPYKDIDVILQEE